MDDTTETSTSTFGSEPKRRWFEPASAILMAVASLSTAWCSYQSSRWSGQSSDFEARADKVERQGIAMHLESREIESVHVRMLMEVVDAHLAGDEKREKFYIDRFTGEIQPAYEKWIALKPYEDPAAPPHPFVPSLYTPRFEQETRDAHAEAGRLEAEASVTGRSASIYLSNTVILATVLFFAGTAGKFDQRRVRQWSLAFAVALFLYAAVRMAMLPVA